MPKSTVESSLVSDLLSTDLRCAICLIKLQMKPDEVEALENVFKKMREKNSSQTGRSQHTLSYNWLLGVLTKHGYTVKKQDIRRYALQQCGICK